MGPITQLQQSEQVRVDRDRLGDLYSQLGEAGAEDIVCRAMEELALRLSHCERLWRENDLDALAKCARSMIAIGEQIGMHALGRVASDVSQTIANTDPVATSATLARLLRIGERSLTAIWDLQDVTL